MKSRGSSQGRYVWARRGPGTASGGSTWPVISLRAIAADPSDGMGATCASGNDGSGFNWVGVCASNDGGAPATQIFLSAFAGEVTYHSLGACQTTSASYDCADGYTWNSGSDTQPTNRHPLVGQVTYALTVTDAGGTSLNASPAIPVAPFTSSDDRPRACERQLDGVSHCFSRAYGEIGVNGSVGQ